MRIFFPIVVVLVFSVGCTQTDTPQQSTKPMVAEETNTPESVYRRFMIANLSGDESKIRPLIVENDDANLLWQGAYPEEVAALLLEQYKSMEISRTDSPDGNEDRVMLESSASPIPIAAVKVEGKWKIDATPIIEFRKAASKAK